MTEYEFEEVVDEEYPEAWNPEPEEVIAGEIVECRKVEVDGRQARLVVLVVNGEHVTVWCSTVIATRFKKAHVRVGDVVRIQYVGRVKSTTSEYHYKNYRVFVAKREEA